MLLWANVLAKLSKLKFIFALIGCEAKLSQQVGRLLKYLLMRT